MRESTFTNAICKAESKQISKDFAYCEDTISRQAAIDALDEIRHALWEIDIPSPTVPEYVEHHEQVQSVWKLLDKKQKELYALPSAQPEPLTDKEQRIFLAAMGREEKICEEVDREEVDRDHVREPYEDSLVRVCHEIIRKVKNALWT